MYSCFCVWRWHLSPQAVGKRRWMASRASKDRLDEGEAGAFHHGAKYAPSPGVREADPAERSGRGPAAVPGQQGEPVDK